MENNTTNSSSGRILGALLLGAAVGATLGILMAPDKGSETRKKIFNGARDMADDLKERVNRLRNKGEEMADLAEDKFDDFKKAGKNKYDQFNKPKTDMV